MKHLNPRQGITTIFAPHSISAATFRCETPKSPPGDYNKHMSPRSPIETIGVKHLNPRQGITTFDWLLLALSVLESARVKHLNPRQGITTSLVAADDLADARAKCETPKSPPGDYNSTRASAIQMPASVNV